MLVILRSLLINFESIIFYQIGQDICLVNITIETLEKTSGSHLLVTLGYSSLRFPDTLDDAIWKTH